MNSWKTGWLLIGLLLSIFFLGLPADGHRSGCHRWHSCPSDRGTYTCGDKGYCSQCPDNQYCRAGRPRGVGHPPTSRTEKSPDAVKGFIGKVVGVSDGDTITVLHNGKGERIRLNGIDSPEKRQAFGKRAKQLTSRLTYGKEVTVQVFGLGRYGRTIADVILPDGRVLNRELVKAGFAWWYKKYSDDQSLGDLEAEARATNRGLWADAKPIPPWDFRKLRRGEGIIPSQRGPPDTTLGALPIIGNKRSKIYHRPDCPSYGRVSPKNRVPFASPEEAGQAGYRLARNCP